MELTYFIVFGLSAIIGSFLNVCIYRLPLGKSIVKPRSACPACDKPIAWFDNIPLFSYLILRGKCRNCGAAFSIRYLIVELITALSGIGLLYYFSLTPQFFVYWLLACMLIVVVMIDIEHMEIPDVISLPGIPIGLVLSTFFLHQDIGFSLPALIDSGLGILAGGVSIYLMGVFGEKAFPEQSEAAGGAVGGGDVKLMAMMGAFLGWKMILVTFFLAPVLGAVVGIYVRIKEKQNVIPYGPFLAIGAIISLLYGDKILNHFFGM